MWENVLYLIQTLDIENIKMKGVLTPNKGQIKSFKIEIEYCKYLIFKSYHLRGGGGERGEKINK